MLPSLLEVECWDGRHPPSSPTGAPFWKVPCLVYSETKRTPFLVCGGTLFGGCTAKPKGHLFWLYRGGGLNKTPILQVNQPYCNHRRQCVANHGILETIGHTQQVQNVHHMFLFSHPGVCLCWALKKEEQNWENIFC